MNQHEYADEAWALPSAPQQERRDAGDGQVTAGFFWGTFTHCPTAVAQSEGPPRDARGTYAQVAGQMDVAEEHNHWRSRFGAAGQLHQHICHGHLDRTSVHDLTLRFEAAAFTLLERMWRTKSQ